MTNRPGSRASAARMARAVLMLDTCIGLTFLIGSWMLWHSAPEGDVPAWLHVAMLLPLAAGTALTIAATLRDRKR